MRTRSVLVGLVLLLASGVAGALEVPAKRKAKHVADYADLLSEKEAKSIRSGWLYDVLSGTWSNIQIAIFPSADGADIKDFTRQLATKWEIDEPPYASVVLTVFVKENEAVLLPPKRYREHGFTEEKGAELVRDVLKPYLEKKKYVKGLDKMYWRMTWGIAEAEAVESHSWTGKMFARATASHPILFVLLTIAVTIFTFWILLISFRLWRARFLRSPF